LDVQLATLETRDEPELTTWYWDPGTFTPIAKERAGRRWSIASDHLELTRDRP
jgi:hypothetical protein